VRIVLDTNVLVAAAATPGLCRRLIRSQMSRHEIIVSEPLLKEFRETLRRKFDFEPENFPFLKELTLRSEIVTVIKLSPPICRDEDDDWVLATALAGNANIILTGDNDLLVLKTFQGIRILSPRQFVEILDEQK
jgi:putative PIN family toxin of toxin-antitoxin system